MVRVLRPEHNGLKVFVYFNLHKKVWSVKALKGESKGKVIGHVSRLVLTDCTFKVSEAGRQRVLREQRKNVHAGVQGTINMFVPLPNKHAFPITYNPYKYETFVLDPKKGYDPTPVKTSDLVTLDTQKGVDAYYL